MLAKAPEGRDTAPSEPTLLSNLLLQRALRAQDSHFPVPVLFSRKSAPRKCRAPRPPTPTPHLAPQRGEAPLLRSQPSLHSSHSALAERQREMEMRMSVENNARKRSERESSPISTS